MAAADRGPAALVGGAAGRVGGVLNVMLSWLLLQVGNALLAVSDKVLDLAAWVHDRGMDRLDRVRGLEPGTTVREVRERAAAE